MKTQGEIESAVSEGMDRFEQEFMGRGPKSVRAHLLGDLLLVRIQGALTEPERHLVKSLRKDQGRDLIKQVRVQLLETARPLLSAMVQGITGVGVRSLHHDISTVTGEKLVAFTLDDMPNCRETRKK